jgi:AcrR family transcriptional regulator
MDHMSDTRRRILTATNELFRRGGYHGTSLKEVIVAAGVTTGSLYHFFPGGKAQLAAASLTDSGASYQQLFELIADDAPDVVAAFASFFDGAADTLEESDFLDVCPIGTVAREMASTDDALRHAADSVFVGWIEAAAARLRAAGVGAAAADELAVTAIAAFEGSLVLARTRRDADLVRGVGRQIAARVAEVVTEEVAAR